MFKSCLVIDIFNKTIGVKIGNNLINLCQKSMHSISSETEKIKSKKKGSTSGLLYVDLVILIKFGMTIIMRILQAAIG